MSISPIHFLKIEVFSFTQNKATYLKRSLVSFTHYVILGSMYPLRSSVTHFKKLRIFFEALSNPRSAKVYLLRKRMGIFRINIIRVTKPN